MGPKKPSGSAFRKMKREREKKIASLAGGLNNWLHLNNEGSAGGRKTNADRGDRPPLTEKEASDCRSHEAENVFTEPIGNEYDSVIPQVEDFAVASSSSSSPSSSSSSSSPSPSSSSSSSSSCMSPKSSEPVTGVNEKEQGSNGNCNQVQLKAIDFEDPAKWPGIPKISDSVRRQLVVDHGPETVDISKFQFPTSDDGRHLNAKWFYRILKNGERLNRHWMIYSRSKDALFCFPCLLFPKGPKLTVFSDFDKGFQDWKRLNPALQIHETSFHHRDSYVAWRDFEWRFKVDLTVDAETQSRLQKEKERRRGILKVVVDVILFCAKNNLAFRGSNPKGIVGEPERGIFLSTLELLSRYHPQLASHMTYAKESESCFSPEIQNELIASIAGKVKEEILKKIKASKYFSIIFACTTDGARAGQMSPLIRFVDLSDGICQIEESFFDFINTDEKNVSGLSNTILLKLRADGLKIDDCRGQAYANGSNVAGEYSGVQARLSQVNELARCMPCAAHSLNLVGSQAASVSPMMLTFFGTVQQIFEFFGGSTGRWQVLMQKLDVALEGHSDTRWSSEQRAIGALKKSVKSVFYVLNDMSDRTNYNEETAFGAQTLTRLMDFRFLCLLHTWERILCCVDEVNQSLQSKAVPLVVANKMLKGLTESLQKMRDDGAEPGIAFAKEKSSEMELEGDFSSVRVKKVKLFHHDGASDKDPEQSLRREINTVYDRILTEIKSRYEAMSAISSEFSFLWGNNLKNRSFGELKKRATDFGLRYSSDVDAVQLVSELKLFKEQGQELVKELESATPMDLLTCIQEYSMGSIFPNLRTALRIYLTLPVTAASCEGSFSKLELIKNYLRSTMSQEGSTSLALLSIEHKMVSQINVDAIVEDFATVKVELRD